MLERKIQTERISSWRRITPVVKSIDIVARCAYTDFRVITLVTSDGAHILDIGINTEVFKSYLLYELAGSQKLLRFPKSY